MIDSIDFVGNLIDNIIRSKVEGTGNIFLRLNETDYYTANKNRICHFPNCTNAAIGSHTFPHSFLKKITTNNKVHSTDIKHIVANVYESEGIEFVRDTHIKYSGVQPLFCELHDDSIFKRVESSKLNIDIETYLSLFLYRAFIYDYELESEFHRPKQVRKLNIDKPYSKKISNEVLDKYLQEQFISNKLIEVNAQYDGYTILKEKFDNLFSTNSSPNYNDFDKYFELKYYDIGCLPGFFASGTMSFTFNQTNAEKLLQSIYAIIPDKALNTSYFSILIPRESVASMSKLIEKLDYEYANDRGTFIKDVEFLLLDASQNVIINDALYKKLQIDNAFSKINYALVMARLPIYLKYSTSLRNYAYEQLKTIELIK